MREMCHRLSVLLLAFAACATPAQNAPQPASAADYMERGLFLAEHGDDFAAEQYFDAARRAGFPEREVVRQLVAVCIEAGRLEQALAHATTYAERAPDDWPMHHVIATLHFAKGDVDSAVSELEQLLVEHPEHAESRYLLAVVRRDGHGDHEAARAAFERYLELSPEGAHAAEARAYLRKSARAPLPAKRRVKS